MTSDRRFEQELPALLEDLFVGSMPAYRDDILMLTAHTSQREWLLKHHGMDHYVNSMRDWGAARGKHMQVAFAEGFRQHLGHSYPQDNMLSALLDTARK